MNGQIGTSTNPVEIDLAGHLDELWGHDIYADIDLSTSTGVGDIGYLNCGGQGGNGNFTGSIKAGSVIGGTSGDQFAILGEFDGDIELSGSLRNLTTSTHWIGDFLSDSLFKVGSIPADAVLRVLGGGMLDGQIIVNQDLNGSFDWEGDIQLPGGIFIGPGQSQPYMAPYYTATSSSLGGGAVGLAPFNFHQRTSAPPLGGARDCDPYQEEVVVLGTSDPLVSVRINHYGPVYVDTTGGGPYFKVEWRLLSSRPWQDRTSLFEVDLTQTADSEMDATRDVVIQKASGNTTGFASAGQWRIRPLAGKVRCAFVDGNPGVEYDSDITGKDAGAGGSDPTYDWYYFQVMFTSGGMMLVSNDEVTLLDVAGWSDNPFEANADGATNSGDLGELIDAMGD